MRRIVGLVLMGLAGFLLAMTALIKFYAYPTLAVVPLDQDSVSTSSGEDMTYFDKTTLSEQTDTLTSKITTIGQVKASEEQGDNVAIWDKSTITTNTAGDVLSVTTRHNAFDRTTGEAVDCCDTTFDDEPTTYHGLLFKFPFNTQKKSYEWWDDDLQDTFTFEYDGEETLQGLKTYRFKASIPATNTGSLNVPSKVLGEKPGEMLAAETWYANDRTYWVEPETGVVIDASETQNNTLRYNGEDRVITTKGTTGYGDDQVAQNIKDYKSKAGQLHLVRAVLPPVGIIVGLLSLVAGALLFFTGRGASGKHEDAPAQDAADA